MKEIGVKLLDIIKHTFRNTTYTKYDFVSLCDINHFNDIKMAEADWGHLNNFRLCQTERHR